MPYFFLNACVPKNEKRMSEISGLRIESEPLIRAYIMSINTCTLTTIDERKFRRQAQPLTKHDEGSLLSWKLRTSQQNRLAYECESIFV